MPNTALGLLTTFGVAEESTYGTAVAPDRFYEVVNESMEREQFVIQSNGLRSGGINLRRGTRRALVRRHGKGSFTLEVPTTTFGRLLKHTLGGTPTIAQQGVTAAWLQTHAMGTTLGKYLTIQKILRDGANAVVQQFTQVGVKIVSAEFSIGNDTQLMVTFETDARDENVSTTAATPSYANNKPFHFAQAAITLAGTPIAKCTDATWKLDRPLKRDLWYLGTAGLKGEPLENDYPMVTGSFTAEFDSANKTAIYDAYAADTSLALVITFTGANIASTFDEKITFTIPDIRLLGETPKVGGADIITVSPSFEGAYDGTNAGMTATYQSTDVAV